MRFRAARNRRSQAAALLLGVSLVAASPRDQTDPADPTDKEELAGQCACGNLNRDKSGDGSDHKQQKAAGGEASLEISSAAQRHNDDLVNIPGGTFYMGTPKHLVHFPQDGEGPVRQVKMSSFAIDKYEVSNDKFREFVEETDYVTEAEEYGDSFVAELWLSKAVSATIDMQVAAVPWWLPVKNCSWEHPEGFDSDIHNRGNHPVLHVSWNDASAYCKWRGGRLPSEAQWEYAARGGKEQKNYPWGNAMQPMRRKPNTTETDGGHPAKEETTAEKDVWRMNIWQGKFPKKNTAKDGFNMTAPVDAFGPQNNYGLYNMVGNAWEWTSDWWTPAHYLTEENQEIGFVDPEGPTVEELDQLKEMGYLEKDAEYEKTKKGGSFMCHKSYCYRYRVCARTKMTPESSAHNVGFRCAAQWDDPNGARPWDAQKKAEEDEDILDDLPAWTEGK